MFINTYAILLSSRPVFEDQVGSVDEHDESGVREEEDDGGVGQGNGRDDCGTVPK